MKDAIKSGDAQLALELVHDGVSLSKADAAKLAPHVRGDEVLTSHDQTRSLSRAALSVLLLVLGVMDLRVMAVVTVAITAERIAPAGQRVARAIGVVVVATGLVLIELAS